MSTQQLLLSLLLATSFAKLNAMDNSLITMESAQKNFNLSWQLLIATQQYQEYQQAAINYENNNNEHNNFLFTIKRCSALITQEGQNFMTWHKFMQKFNNNNPLLKKFTPEEHHTIRYRSKSAPVYPRRYSKNQLSFVEPNDVVNYIDYRYAGDHNK